MPTISRTSHLFPAGLALWAHLTCLFEKLERCLGCTARDVEIQSNLSEREFHCNTLPDDSPTKVSRIRWLASWFSRHRDCPGVYKFELTAFYREAHSGFSPTSDILAQEADHEYCYELALTPYAVFERNWNPNPREWSSILDATGIYGNCDCVSGGGASTWLQARPTWWYMNDNRQQVCFVCM